MFGIFLADYLVMLCKLKSAAGCVSQVKIHRAFGDPTHIYFLIIQQYNPAGCRTWSEKDICLENLWHQPAFVQSVEALLRLKSQVKSSTVKEPAFLISRPRFFTWQAETMTCACGKLLGRTIHKPMRQYNFNAACCFWICARHGGYWPASFLICFAGAFSSCCFNTALWAFKPTSTSAGSGAAAGPAGARTAFSTSDMTASDLSSCFAVLVVLFSALWAKCPRNKKAVDESQSPPTPNKMCIDGGPTFSAIKMTASQVRGGRPWQYIYHTWILWEMSFQTTGKNLPPQFLGACPCCGSCKR